MSPRSPDFKRSKNIPELISDTSTKRPQLQPETGWYRLAVTELFEGVGVGGQFLGSTLAVFKNSWDNIAGATNAPASFYNSNNGEARFRGKIVGGAAAGEVMTTLPEEIRPEFAQTFIVPISDSGVVDLSLIRFRVFSDGE